ncbi:MAG: energy-coupling factor transporter ATPase, partial [Oscillospiraceae bacterium]|nr:energy-coupling factor transporter ATPase [Oscillospiraceae bacterium]
GLDPEGRREILGNIEEYRKVKNATIIMVSHSMADVAAMTDRLLVMNNASLAMDGTPEAIFDRADELLEMGLDIPEITRVFMKLRQKGVSVPNVYSISDAVRVLNKLRGGPADA